MLIGMDDGYVKQNLLPAFLNLITLFLRLADDIILLASSDRELGHGERTDETENRSWT
jgi:hypothetical protein